MRRAAALLLAAVVAACTGPGPSPTGQRPPAQSPPIEPSPAASLADNGPEIVFAGAAADGSDLYLLDIDRPEDAQALDPGPSSLSGVEYAPVWSPDGRRLAHHTLTADGRDALVVFDLDTGRQAATVDVGFPPVGAVEASWSPEGSRLAYWSTSDASNEIRVLDVATGTSSNLTDHPSADRFPAWSPSENLLAFWTDRSGRGELWLMASDGTGPRALAEIGAAHAPSAWSPAGQRLVTTIQRAPTQWISAVLDLEGQRLGEFPALGSSVGGAWSPDGRRVAYWDVVGPVPQLMVADEDGNNATAIGPHPGSAAGAVLASHPSGIWPPAPSWSPTGDQLVAGWPRDDGSSALLLAIPASGEWRVLEGPTLSAASPAWRPTRP